MGIAPFNIASSVILITAQRLARRLCAELQGAGRLSRARRCSTPASSEEDLDGTWKPYRPVGCSACNNGYKGRVGIYQVMPITEEIQRIILADGSALDIAKQAEREGVRDLRQSGLIKVRHGRHLARRSAGLHQRISTHGSRRSHGHMAPQSAQDHGIRLRVGRARTATASWCAAKLRAAGENQVQAALRRQGVLATKVKKRRMRRRQDQAQGHRDLHAPAGDHDEGRRAAAAVLRHRRPRQCQPQRRQAAERHPHRRRDRHLAVGRLPQVPAVLRHPVLQPGRSRRGRAVSWKRCSTAWRSTWKRPRRSSPRSSRR